MMVQREMSKHHGLIIAVANQTKCLSKDVSNKRGHFLTIKAKGGTTTLLRFGQASKGSILLVPLVKFHPKDIGDNGGQRFEHKI